MRRWLVPLILLSAFILRVFWLAKLPVGFTPDEASFGYDAYSMLKTGADQWGQKLPLVLESFGDFKAPLYAYLTVPFVALLGLNKTAVRLPNAIVGTLAVLVTYLLVNELFSYALRVSGSKKLTRNTQTRNKLTALTASFLLTISPWHIMMSRGAFEANLTTFFLPLGILLFLRGLKKPKFLSWSALVFGLNLFTYHSAKFVTPLIVIFIVYFFRKQIRKVPTMKIIFAGAITGIFLVVTVYTFSLGGGARVTERSIFQGALQEASVARFASIQKGTPALFARLLHNKYQVTIKRFLGNYGSYFSAKFLFKDGPAETTYGMIPGRGVLYWFELPFLFGFLIVLFKKKYLSLSIIMFWLLMAPIPASLATGVGYAANRSVVMLPALTIAEAYGAIYLYKTLRKKVSANNSKWVLVGYGVIAVVSLAAFISNYLASPVKTAEGMLDGNLEAAYWLRKNTTANDEILVSRKLSEPQIYVAFASKWKPADYQNAAQKWNYKELNLGWVDQQPEYKLGHYLFGSIDRNKDYQRYTYVVGRPNEFPESVSPLMTINYPDGKPSIFIVSQKPRYAQEID